MNLSSLDSAAANYTYLRVLFFVPLAVLPAATALASRVVRTFGKPGLLTAEDTNAQA